MAKFLKVNEHTADNFMDTHEIVAKELGMMVFSNSFGLKVKKLLVLN
ncbi:Uncharacterized protein NEOC95_002192 [Neochlamydia sp. AcF95]|nr:Uncharacterized protein [Neochlamydia sp. AcF95]